MHRRVFRLISQFIGSVFSIAAVASIGLCGFCYLNTTAFINGADTVEATIVELHRLPIDNERGTRGHRMAVAFTDSTGQQQKVGLSGFYRSGADTIGQPISLLYNPTHKIRAAVATSSLWIGVWVYGVASAALVLAGIAAFMTARRLRQATVLQV